MNSNIQFPTVVNGPIYAWRAWHLYLSAPDWDVLRSLEWWEECKWPQNAPLRAACRKNPHHKAPEWNCECGIHASQDLPAVIEYTCNALGSNPLSVIIGTVAIFGSIIKCNGVWYEEQNLGYRAEYARPAELALAVNPDFYNHANRERCLVIATTISQKYGVPCHLVEVNHIAQLRMLVDIFDTLKYIGGRQ